MSDSRDHQDASPRDTEVIEVDGQCLNVIKPASIFTTNGTVFELPEEIIRAVDATAAQVECDFSTCGNLLVPNRCRIDSYWVKWSCSSRPNYEHISEYGDIPMISSSDMNKSLGLKGGMLICWPLKLPLTCLKTRIYILIGCS